MGFTACETVMVRVSELFSSQTTRISTVRSVAVSLADAAFTVNEPAPDPDSAENVSQSASHSTRHDPPGQETRTVSAAAGSPGSESVDGETSNE